MAKRNGHDRSGFLTRYKTYLWRGKDRQIDEMRTLVEDHFGHRITKKDLRQIERDGGPTYGCTSGWFFGETVSPKNVTLDACGHAVGYERKWVRAK